MRTGRTEKELKVDAVGDSISIPIQKDIIWVKLQMFLNHFGFSLKYMLFLRMSQEILVEIARLRLLNY
jgi:hypothetical protein